MNAIRPRTPPRTTKTTSRQKQLCRLAHSIYDVLQTQPRLQLQRPSTPSFQLPEAAWQECQRWAGRLQAARQRGWHAAARHVEADLASALQRCRTQICQSLTALEAQHRQPTLPLSLREIYRDLRTLDDEFDAVSWTNHGLLAVTTAPITLEGIELGRFRIELHWQHLPEPDYAVVALDPHPAAANDSVTHPHVQDSELCAGEAREPLRRALAEGRLADFFLIVAAVLNTYNDANPYIALSEWEGGTCVDCGATVSANDRQLCVSCDSHLCQACYVRCRQCNEAFCAECSSTCDGCGDDTCRSCLTVCTRCGARVCPSCHSEKDCEKCHVTTHPDQPETEPGAAAAASAPVLPDDLVPTAVPA